MNVELVVFGAVSIAAGFALAYLSRHLYPRLELADDALDSVRLLTTLIVTLLALAGLGLVVIGLTW
ncbi:hypothetical protein [Salinadaptatus halalkaliphilus]|uniref:hypothetical protein n=1 Tax=Salinadaptatus halalkaliphilus TaxID=2419781 RepID=UPI001FE4CF32|nr:hypothetical protein [Salinadaptatus halalkaliphilus]